MRYDDRPQRLEVMTQADVERLETLSAQILDRQHPDSDTVKEIAAKGSLVSAAQEHELQAIANGERSKGEGIAEEMRALLGMNDGTRKVGQRTHDGAMASSSAAKYDALVSAMKDLIANRAEADALVDVAQDQSNHLDVDRSMNATVNEVSKTKSLQSEVDFLKSELEKMQKQMAAERALKDNRFSARGAAQTNRYGIGA